MSIRQDAIEIKHSFVIDILKCNVLYIYHMMLGIFRIRKKTRFVYFHTDVIYMAEEFEDKYRLILYPVLQYMCPRDKYR